MKLYDSRQAEEAARAAAQGRQEARQRAQEAERLAEGVATDAAAQALEQKLGRAISVSSVKYEKARRPGSKWLIEHGRDGDDYVFQVFPLRPPAADPAQVLLGLIVAMDQVFPRTVELKYHQPNPKFEVRFYTIRAVGVTKMPGWERACRERATELLLGVDAWSTAGA